MRPIAALLLAAVCSAGVAWSYPAEARDVVAGAAAPAFAQAQIPAPKVKRTRKPAPRVAAVQVPGPRCRFWCDGRPFLLVVGVAY